MKDKRQELLLMQIIRINGNVLALEKYGLSPAEILKWVNVLKEEGKVEFDGDNIMLTKEGSKYYNHICRDLNYRGIYKHFIDDGPIKGMQMPIDQVYIPRKRAKKLK